MLAFIARRVSADPIVLIGSLRTGTDAPFARAGLPEIMVRGLDAAAAREVMMTHAGDLSYASQERILATAQGNPLALAALTAWQALVDYAALEPGERVLVQGGAGGVGLFAVQLAAILGGHVIATGRGHDADFVRGLGAERFVSTDAGDPAETAGGFDVVIDTVGGAVLDASYRLLREGGRLVTLGAPPDRELARKHHIHAMFFVVAQDPRELADLAEMAGTGRLRTVVSQTFPLAEGRSAFESGRYPRPPGKTVLVVRP